jgi:hypothetical protein
MLGGYGGVLVSQKERLVPSVSIPSPGTFGPRRFIVGTESVGVDIIVVVD